jgi:Ca2+-dependent lipid-binding protein
VTLYGPQKVRHKRRTRTVGQSVNPLFGQTLHFDVPSVQDWWLGIKVYAEKLFSRENIGSLRFDFASLPPGEVLDVTRPLTHPPQGNLPPHPSFL